MQLKCKSCNKLYNLNLKKIGDYLNQKRSLGLCEDCFLNKKWDADYRNNRLRYSDYFNVNLTKIPDIDIFDTDLYFKLNQIIEINRCYQQTPDAASFVQRPLYINLILKDKGKIVSGFPVSIKNFYLILKQDIYSPDIDNGLHHMGDAEFKIPFYQISRIKVFHDYHDVYCPDVPESIIGYKAVTETNGILKTHNYIYEIGIPYEEEQRNIYTTDFQDCYSHFCRNIEDVILCSGKTDFISSQINPPAYSIIRLFKIKAEKHCLQITKRGWVTNKLTLLEEITKKEIIDYFEEHSDAKELIINHYKDFQIFEKLKESKVEPYIATNTNEAQIYTMFIKSCDKYNIDSCLQGNDCAVENCKLCNSQQIRGWLDSKDLKYLLVKYRILNGLFSFQDPDYQYLKEHNCHAEVQSLKRLLAHHTPK